MTLDEAIQELTKQLRSKYSNPHTPFHNAMKILIEAGKVVKEFRTGRYKTINSPLPGETGDDNE